MSFWADPLHWIEQWLQQMLLNAGLSPALTQFVLFVAGAFLLATFAMLYVTFLIWLERKVIARIQDRLGPNRVGPWGLFQPLADMLKIFTKELITPEGADRVPYNLAPILSVASVLMIWAVIPFSLTVYGVDLNVGVLYIIATGGLGLFSILMAGWGSNNKYALLGGFRAVAQLISYEVPMVVSLLVPVMLSGSMGMNDITRAQSIWYVLLSPLAALIFFLTSVAEVGRAPFDLVEAESELVAGFNIEYSGLKFGMFFVAEFLHAFTISLLFATIFLGGWRGPGAETYPVLGFVYYLLKTSLAYFLVILMRGTLPRLRIDQMMDFNWKLLTPVSLVVVIFTALAAKLVQGAGSWVLLAVLLPLNLLIGAVTLEIVRRRVFRRRRLLVGPKQYTIPQQVVSMPPEEG